MSWVLVLLVISLGDTEVWQKNLTTGIEEKISSGGGISGASWNNWTVWSEIDEQTWTYSTFIKNPENNVTVLESSAPQPGDPDIGDGWVVWQHYNDPSANSSIWAADLRTLTPFPVTRHPDTAARPRTDGGRVVWYDWRNSNSDIWAMDLINRTEWGVTSNPSNQWWPDIGGDFIVWSDTRLDPAAWDIFGYEISTGEEFLISDADGLQFEPVTDGNLAAWRDYRTPGNGRDIWAMDLDTRTEFSVVTNPFNQWHPSIDGNTILWYDDRNGDFDIFGANIGPGGLGVLGEFLVAGGPGNQTNPNISGGNVVYLDESTSASIPEPAGIVLFVCGFIALVVKLCQKKTFKN